MFKKLLNTKVLKNQKGLTLIELLAVIVILAIIAAIAIPAISNIIAKQKDKSILADTSTMLSGAKLAYANGECGAPASNVVTCGQTVIADYAEGGNIPASGVSATYNESTKVWEITNPNLANIKKLTVTGLAANDNTLTEDELNTAMGNK